MWSTGDLLDWLPRLSKKTSAPPPSLQKIAAYPILLKDVKATSRFHVFSAAPGAQAISTARGINTSNRNITDIFQRDNWQEPTVHSEE